ncbi:SDR family NAD(P)-dependent oxidoreductase [Streptomyces inhibens]|uniref:SDR family NAD(P)-dependent oxidoreductase n=1 Tax=Streptomyces inhibens TaxID=2293571 RepID=UPI003787317B
MAALADGVREGYGCADVLANNAGISQLTPAEDTTAAQWRRALETNLTGPFLLFRALGRLMLDAGGGAIVNIASIAGLHGIADRAACNASKHGLIGLTRTLAAEWGGRGVRVNAVCPGWVRIEMDAADQSSGGYTDDDDVVERVPMARFAAPEDIARATAFLADPGRSGFINGVALPVDGGWTADASWTSLRLRKCRPRHRAGRVLPRVVWRCALHGAERSTEQPAFGHRPSAGCRGTEAVWRTRG